MLNWQFCFYKILNHATANVIILFFVSRYKHIVNNQKVKAQFKTVLFFDKKMVKSGDGYTNLLFTAFQSTVFHQEAIYSFLLF
jgi:hypothetical protein